MSESDKKESENTEAESRDTEKLEAAEGQTPAEAPTEVQEPDTVVQADGGTADGQEDEAGDDAKEGGLAIDRHRPKVIGATAAAILVAGALFLTPGNRLLGLGDSEAHSEDHHGLSDEGPEGHGPEGMLPPGAEGGPEGGFHGAPGGGEYDEHDSDGPEAEDQGSDDSGQDESESDESGSYDRGADSQAPSAEQGYGQSGSAPPMETGQS